MTTNSWLDYYQEQRKRIVDIRQRPIVLEAGLCGVELVGKHLRYFVYKKTERQEYQSLLDAQIGYLQSEIEAVSWDMSDDGHCKYYSLMEELRKLQNITGRVKEITVETIWLNAGAHRMVCNQVMECVLDDGTVVPIHVKANDTPAWHKQYVDRHTFVGEEIMCT